MCVISESARQASQPLSDATRLFCTKHYFFPQPIMETTSYEARISLALNALQRDLKLSNRAVAKIYTVNKDTLRDRRAGRPARCDIQPNSRKLTDLEEKTIVQYIVELCARAFHLRLLYVEDIANRLLRERDAPPVGVR